VDSWSRGTRGATLRNPALYCVTISVGRDIKDGVDKLSVVCLVENTKQNIQIIGHAAFEKRFYDKIIFLRLLEDLR